MKVECIVTKELDIDDFISWLKKQSSEYVDYWRTYDYILLNKYLKQKYPEVESANDLALDEIVSEIDRHIK